MQSQMTEYVKVSHSRLHIGADKWHVLVLTPIGSGKVKIYVKKKSHTTCMLTNLPDFMGIGTTENSTFPHSWQVATFVGGVCRGREKNS